ncbi:hypothetical protein ABS71_05130 [bacterium SCN 62-11]|nr:CAP domain-containing protein [Candidatus Eremiobacteraeota bacterium]ODT74916.1 MAG: hypothetical protein ABS71_05130 [bacterium SCN 62-11]
MKGLLCLALLLSAPVFAQTASDAIAQEIFTLSNQARQKAGLPALEMDPKLSQAAVQHSQEMDSLNYFGHGSPLAQFSTLAKRLNLQNYFALTSAENLHRDQGYGTIRAAQRTVQAWLNSPVHRKNLLNGRYNRVGVGVSVVGDQCTITQDFGYSAIEVIEKAVDPKPQGYHVVLHCLVTDGVRHGALLHEGKRFANWEADAQGKFQVEADVPGPGTVSLGQADGERQWTVETEFSIPQN